MIGMFGKRESEKFMLAVQLDDDNDDDDDWALKTTSSGIALGIMVIIIRNGIGDRSSNLSCKCVSLCANALEKSMNQSVLPIQLWVNNRAD